MVNKSPSHSALQDCLQLIGDDDGLLLLEDGVYAAMSQAAVAAQLARISGRGVRLYAIGEDLAMRGLSQAVSAFVEAIDYDGFVSLTTHYKAIQSWY